MSAINRELLKGSTELVLLALLEHESLYGYQLVKKARAASAEVLQLKEGSLYPALHRLEQGGLITGYWQYRDDGTNRKYYQLTPLGKEALQERKEEWQRFVAAIEGVLRYA